MGKYSAPTASTESTVVTVHTSCVEGCHEKILLEDAAATAEIVVPAAATTSTLRKGGKKRTKMLCEFWISTLAANKVSLAVTEFKVGKKVTPCSTKKGKVIIDKGGNKFFSSDPETKCGKLGGFTTVSSGSTLTLAVMGKKKAKFSATATMAT